MRRRGVSSERSRSSCSSLLTATCCLPCWMIVRATTQIKHYNDVIMSALASQITSLTIVYSTVYLRRGSKKTSKLRVTGLCEGNSPVTGEFPAERTSNAENVSIWWRHHETISDRRLRVSIRHFRVELMSNRHRPSRPLLNKLWSWLQCYIDRVQYDIVKWLWYMLINWGLFNSRISATITMTCIGPSTTR